MINYLKLSNSYLLKVGLILILITACKNKPEQSSEEESVKRPNVLFISVDDLKPVLGSYGNNLVHSPNMDKLASEGLLFNNHYVQVPTCGASRYALMTGNRPRTRAHLGNNIFAKEMAEKPEEEQPESFVHQLRRNGYYTVGIGKLSHSADGLVYGYEEQPSIQKEMPYSWDDFLFNSGKWNTGWNAFFAYANGENRQSLKRQVKPYEKAEVSDEEYPDGLTAELAIETLKKLKNRDTPFFMGVGFFKPHLPFNAPKKYWDFYNRDEIATAIDSMLPENVNRASLHASNELNGYQFTDEKASLDKPLSKAYSKKLIHAYYASVSYIDAQVGKVLKELEKQGLAENTIIVLWGDHGWHLGNNRVWGKHTLFESALKSALIVKIPDGVKGSTNAITETVDIYPTILELCNVDLKGEIDGNSFIELLKTGSETDNVAYSYFKSGITMRTKNYRLTKYFREAAPKIELYDHRVDSKETNNIASENPAVVQELMKVLEKGDTGIYSEK